MRTFATTQRSRIPVYEGTLDHIKGFVHIKDLIWFNSIAPDAPKKACPQQILICKVIFAKF